IQAFRAHGAELDAVRGDADGLDTDALEAALAGGARPKIVSVVSEFANPTGATLSEPRRHHLVELARRYNFVVVDDNPYGELRWSGKRPPSLAAVAARMGDPERVITLGSASKILAPGLRIGWLTAAPPVLDAVVRMKQSADLHTSTLDQLVVASVLADEAALEAHLGRLRRCYRRRCEALADELEREFSGTIELDRPDGGMFVWVRCVDRTVDTMEWFEHGITAGVAFVPGAAFSVDGSWGWALRACFATLEEAQLFEAVRRMTEGFRRIRRAKCAIHA
ncbi:MAG: PLP-dependent aminotransferase family protein, partial [Actinobacteria bacterium]|nr:PLP-dependent aminotransferase family protein [Actinomycetota bacterium]